MLSEDGRNKIKTLNKARKALEDVSDESIVRSRYKNALLELINGYEAYDIERVIIHGVVRFTPEIMMLIEVLDRCGIEIIFTFNYCANLEDLYGPWKRAYSWVGSKFENVGEINLSEGREPGRTIAEITLGKRSQTTDCAKYKKYTSLTDFTDSEVRKVFENAQKVNPSHPLSNMKIQYYSVDANKPNDVLRNYFPEQFLEKPFMAYPVGQFVKGLFEMWDFEKNEIFPDFSLMKDCSLVKIAHSRDDMFSVLNKIEVYYKDIDSLKTMIDRTDKLLAKIKRRESISEWKENDTKYMNYNKSEYDVKKYMSDSRIMPILLQESLMNCTKRL